MKTVNIYTDGACSGNQNENNIGGFGAILEYGDVKKELWGGEINTTNNRMELLALIEALSALKKKNQVIRVFSDSSYLVNCFNEKWYVKWQQNDWKTSAKKPVENIDLWERLLALVAVHNVSFFCIKGHIKVNGAERVLKKLYENFLTRNSANFTFEEFAYIASMNNQADKLANIGILEQKKENGES